MGNGYRGSAVLRVGDDRITVEIRMSARFEPLEGRIRWAGRTGPQAVLAERVGDGLREAELTIPGAAPVRVRVGEPDPWGGVRLTGTGTPPWKE
ncbi:MAG: DUF4873 domain-containing protein [Actinoplanes sp.]